MGTALGFELGEQLLLVLSLLSLVGGESLEMLLNDLLLMHHSTQSSAPAVPTAAHHPCSE